jgi:hypothetical protein
MGCDEEQLQILRLRLRMTSRERIVGLSPANKKLPHPRRAVVFAARVGTHCFLIAVPRSLERLTTSFPDTTAFIGA